MTLDVAHLKKPSDPLMTLSPSGPLQLWVDSQDRVRQVRFSFSYPQTPVVTETSDYTNFGAAINVTIPSASEVESFQQWLKDFSAAAKAAHPDPGSG